MTAHPPLSTPPRIVGPLFGGYALVACVCAWVAGIALRPIVPLPPLGWLIGAVAALALALAAWVLACRVRSLAHTASTRSI